VKSGGEVLRIEASLAELKALALENPLIFDKALNLPPPAAPAP
jgi:hypothetical protein